MQKQLQNTTGQKITVFTPDQQLHSVDYDIMLADCNCWMFFVPWLGGMHQLVSFIGGVGALMAGSGLKEILSSAFAGSDKILLKKNSL